MRIFDAAINVTFGSKIHNHLYGISFKQISDRFLIANVAFDKNTDFPIDIPGNGAVIPRIGEGIQNYYPDIGVISQQIFYVIGSNKTGATGDKISFHTKDKMYCP